MTDKATSEAVEMFQTHYYNEDGITLISPLFATKQEAKEWPSAEHHFARVVANNKQMILKLEIPKAILESYHAAKMQEVVGKVERIQMEHGDCAGCRECKIIAGLLKDLYKILPQEQLSIAEEER